MTPPRSSQPDQLEPFHHLCHIWLSVPVPNTSRRLADQEDTVGPATSTPPRFSQFDQASMPALAAGTKPVKEAISDVTNSVTFTRNLRLMTPSFRAVGVAVPFDAGTPGCTMNRVNQNNHAQE